MTKSQVQQRLADLSKLKIHPRDQAENKAAMARAERVFEETLGQGRMEVGNAMDQFRATLEKQDLALIAEARIRMSAFLDQVDKSFLP